MTKESNNRPHVILSAAMTIDGKIASAAGDPELSDEKDWKEVHELRTKVDGILVGKGTILKDDPKLHIKYHEHEGYHRIVADSLLSIPLDSKVITYRPKLYPTVICTSSHAPRSKDKAFEDRGVKIVVTKNGTRVDMRQALSHLHEIGIKSILLEGGGTLNWSFVKHDLIDEMRLTIAPWMAGGSTATSLVEGEGFKKMSESPRYELCEARARENYVTLRYKRGR